MELGCATIGIRRWRAAGRRCCSPRPYRTGLRNARTTSAAGAQLDRNLHASVRTATPSSRYALQVILSAVLSFEEAVSYTASAVPRLAEVPLTTENRQP